MRCVGVPTTNTSTWSAPVFQSRLCLGTLQRPRQATGLAPPHARRSTVFQSTPLVITSVHLQELSALASESTEVTGVSPPSPPCNTNMHALKKERYQQTMKSPTLVAG